MSTRLALTRKNSHTILKIRAILFHFTSYWSAMSLTCLSKMTIKITHIYVYMHSLCSCPFHFSPSLLHLSHSIFLSKWNNNDVIPRLWYNNIQCYDCGSLRITLTISYYYVRYTETSSVSLISLGLSFLIIANRVYRENIASS